MDMNIINDKLQKALSLNDDNQLIITLCDQMLQQGRKYLGDSEYLRVSVIRNYAAIQMMHFQEARQNLKRLNIEFPGTIDILYLLFNLEYKLNNFKKATEYGDQFLNNIDKSICSTKSVTDARLKVHEICNNLGSLALKLNEPEKAIGYFQKGLTYNNKYALLYQNLSIVYSQLGQWKTAENILNEGMTQCSGDAELYRIFGVVYQNQYYFQKSRELYDKAIRLGSHEALFDMALNYHTLLKYKDANKYLKNFLKHQPHNDEARKIYEALKASPLIRWKEPTISVSMIVKNEEKLLGQCLESIKDIADEIVVVDTGSTDRTVEIAKKNGAKVFHYPWRDDFSKARNYSIAKSTGKWIFYIDADEVLVREDIPKVMKAKWQKKYDAVLFNIFSQLPGLLGGVSQGKHIYPRLFKNRKDIYFEGIVHNVLRMPKRYAMSEIRLMHYGYDLDKDRMKRKFERSMPLLLKQVEKKPNDPYIRFNTAQMLLSRSHYAAAEIHILKIFELLSPDDKRQQHIFLMGLYQMAVIKLRQDKIDEAERYCNEALEIKPDYIDPIHMLSLIYWKKKEYQKAQKMLYYYLEVRERYLESSEYNLLILNKVGNDFEVHYVLGEINYAEGNVPAAKEALEKSIQSNPYFWKCYVLMGKIALHEGDYRQACEAMEMGIKYGYMNAEQYGSLGTSQQEYSDLLKLYNSTLQSLAQNETSQVQP